MPYWIRPRTIVAGLLVCCCGPAAGRDWNPEEPPYGVLSLADTGDTSDVVGEVSDTTLVIQHEGQGVRVPYYANRLIDEGSPDVTRAIVILHGTLRNADDYYLDGIEAGQDVPGALDQTIVVAPQFLIEPDLDEHEVPADIPFWAYFDWRRGDPSASSPSHPRGVRLSSFTIVDSILLRLAERNPNLESIVLAGHSAGGQFVNRYAAGNQVDPVLAGQYGISVRYVISNPSTYLYMNEERWILGTAYAFAVPEQYQINQCPTYDDYQYGLEGRNPYMSIPEDAIRAQYASREVVYLLGGSDTDPNSPYLDKDCPALLQGAYRLQRGMVYCNHLIHFFGEGIFERHRLSIVPGVGHDHRRMFTSACGVYYFFDSGSCPAIPPATPWVDVTTDVLSAWDTQSVSWADMDADGDQDLFLAAYGTGDKLLRNDAFGNFSDVTPQPMKDAGAGVAAAWGDVNNDGLPDLYLVNAQGGCRLFQNNGHWSFSDATVPPLDVGGSCTDASWIDHDNDGDLDLFVTRASGGENVLLRNDEGEGFVDVTPSVLRHAGTNRGQAWGDYDRDGDLDVFIACNGNSILVRNDGGGSFHDATQGTMAQGNASSASWGDLDDDGDIDLYIVRRDAPNRYFRNDGGTFTDATTGPLGLQANGRSATLGDYDNDGRLDIYVCNNGQANVLLHNEGAGVFTTATTYPLDETGQSYGAAWADFDRDGDLDLYMASNSGPNRLFRNENPWRNHYVQIDLVGTESNRSSIGALVACYPRSRAPIWRQVGGDGGYVSQNSATVEFGLADAFGIDSLRILWPSGIDQRIHTVAFDRRHTFWESDQPEQAPDLIPEGARLALRVVPNPNRGDAVIAYRIPAPGRVRIDLLDASGRLVGNLAADPLMPSGDHRVVWDGRALAPGVYLLRLRSEGGEAHTSAVRVH